MTGTWNTQFLEFRRQASLLRRVLLHDAIAVGLFAMASLLGWTMGVLTPSVLTADQYGVLHIVVDLMRSGGCVLLLLALARCMRIPGLGRWNVLYGLFAARLVLFILHSVSAGIDWSVHSATGEWILPSHDAFWTTVSTVSSVLQACALIAVVVLTVRANRWLKQGGIPRARLVTILTILISVFVLQYGSGLCHSLLVTALDVTDSSTPDLTLVLINMAVGNILWLVDMLLHAWIAVECVLARARIHRFFRSGCCLRCGVPVLCERERICSKCGWDPLPECGEATPPTAPVATP